MNKREIVKRALRETCEKLLREAAGGDKPTLYFLIGPPAVGKSTWIKSNLPKDVVVVNRDEMVEKVAADSGVGTYDDMFTRVPKEITPPGMPTKADLSGPGGKDEAARYASQLPGAATKFNGDPENAKTIARFGEVVPFTADDLFKVIAVYGVPPQFVVPFSYSKVKDANDSVTDMLDSMRKTHAEERRSMAIDMTNMSMGERDSHRKFIMGAIEGTDNPDPRRVGEYYDQVAIVFAPEGGYSPEDQEKVKLVAAKRAEEIKLGGGSKTIPPAAYDRMFTMFQEPQDEEGFSRVQYVGIPSLQGLNQDG